MQTDGDLGWYDYGVRFYDPEIGRWTTQDSYTEAFFQISSYSYVKNNPILRIDPDGQWDIEVHSYKNRGEYGFAVLIMRDNNGKEVYRTNVRVQGYKAKENNFNPRNRKATYGDTPTGTYNIKGWSNRLPSKNRDTYGPNDVLELEYISGEAADSRSGMHVHGGKQEKKEDNKWVKDENAHLWNTGGCMRILDNDLKKMKEISQKLETNGYTEKPGELKVADDLMKNVDDKNKTIYEYKDKNNEPFWEIIARWTFLNPSIQINIK